MTEPPRLTPLAAIRAGVRAGFGTPVLVLMASFVGFGGLAHDAGWPLPAVLLSSVLIWALPGQVLLMGALAAGASPIAALIATSLSAVRLFPMVVSLMPLLRAPRMGVAVQLWCAHFIAQTAWVEGFRLLPDIAREQRPVFFLGLGHVLVTASVIASAVGYRLAGRLAEPLLLGLVFVTPAFFLLSLERGARGLEEKLAVVLGLALCPLMVAVAPGFDLMLTGIVGGAVAVAAGVVRERCS